MVNWVGADGDEFVCTDSNVLLLIIRCDAGVNRQGAVELQRIIKHSKKKKRGGENRVFTGTAAPNSDRWYPWNPLI